MFLIGEENFRDRFESLYSTGEGANVTMRRDEVGRGLIFKYVKGRATTVHMSHQRPLKQGMR